MQPTPEETREIAEKVRSGEYFQEMRSMYDFHVHDPMAERYLYLTITTFAALILLVTLVAMQSLYPLESSVPFIVSTQDITDEVPRIQSLLAKKGDNAEEALLTFMVKNYVTFREGYNIETFDRNINGIKSQSSEQVFAEFQEHIDPRNAESPITLYQRHSVRTIEIESTELVEAEADGEEAMNVTYIASVSNKSGVKKSRWSANIAFNYSGIAIDDKTGKVKPVTFIVTQYRTKRLQDL